MFNSKLITSSSTWLLPAGSGVSKHKKLLGDSDSVGSGLWPIWTQTQKSWTLTLEKLLECKVGSICFARKLESWSQEPIFFFPEVRIFEVGSSQLTTAVVNAACEDSGVGEWLQLIGSESRSVSSSYPLIGWSWSTRWVSFQRFSAG